MNCTVKIFSSWLLILILTLGFMPVSYALDLDSNYHATSCELMLSDSIYREQIGSFEESDFIGCQDFSVCVVHYSCAPLHSSSVLTVTSPVMVDRTIPIGDVRVLTRYLDILERPPKV